MVPTQRSMCAFPFGARTGVRMTLMFALARRASKAQENLASRSWMRNRTGRLRSSSSIRRLRACCSIQAVFRLVREREVLDATAANEDEREQVDAAQPDGVDGQPLSFSA